MLARKSILLFLISSLAWGDLAGNPSASTVTSTDLSQGDVSVTIGNVQSANFIPEVSLSKWNGESSLMISISKTGDVTATKTIDGKIQWTASDGTIYRFYNKASTDINYGENSGGLEYEIEYDAPPATNSIVFTIDTTNFTFIKQLPLNQEHPKASPCTETHCEIENGLILDRPTNIVNSYAVYHSSKKNNQFKTGKAFHILRPQAIDSKSQTTWCDIDINTTTGLMTITIPPSFLASAIYPVIVDPTLGYTTIGGSSVANFCELDQAFGSSGTSGYTISENGTLNDVQIYMSDRGYGAIPTTFGVYNQGTNYPGTLFASSSEINLNGDATNHWYSAPASGSLISGNTYWPAENCSGAGKLPGFQYDSVSQAMKYVSSAYTAGSLDNPYPGSATTFDGQVSAYLDYTASGGGPTASSYSKEKYLERIDE